MEKNHVIKKCHSVDTCVFTVGSVSHTSKLFVEK